jgi:hypothetical protein
MIKKVSTLAIPKIPDNKAIDKVLDHNKRFVTGNLNLNYEIVCKEYNPEYVNLQPLFKIELEKWDYILNNPFCLLIDWDLVIEDIFIDKIEKDKIYLGQIGKHARDSFIMLNTYEDIKWNTYLRNLIYTIRNRLLIQEKYVNFYKYKEFSNANDFITYKHLNFQIWNK